MIFNVIVILREDPLSTGILDVFFQKTNIIRVFTKRELKYLKMDPIKPKFFVIVKRTSICISSHKLLLNRLISMEVRFNTFPFSC